MQCNLVRSCFADNGCLTHYLTADRSSLPQSATETHTHLAHSIVRYLSLSSPAELAEFGLKSAADLVDFISRVRRVVRFKISKLTDSPVSQFITNTFTLTSPSLTPIGIAVSPLVALINHSCEPNAVVVFPRGHPDPKKHEPRMQVVALRQINKDEEVRSDFASAAIFLIGRIPRY